MDRTYIYSQTLYICSRYSRSLRTQRNKKSLPDLTEEKMSKNSKNSQNSSILECSYGIEVSSVSYVHWESAAFSSEHMIF